MPSPCNRLARPARRSCSFGSSGLFGFSSFFDSPGGFAGSANKTDQIDQINQSTQPLVPPVAHVSRHGPWPLSYECEGHGQATTPVFPTALLEGHFEQPA